MNNERSLAKEITEGFEALKSMRNNKPVAWMDEINTFVLDKDYQQFPKSLQNGMIPLYTPPVKELDRELLDKTIIDQQNEIKDLRKNLDVALMIVNKPELTDEEIADMVCSGEYWELSEGQVIIAVHFDKFARAILRKAQEK